MKYYMSVKHIQKLYTEEKWISMRSIIKKCTHKIQKKKDITKKHQAKFIHIKKQVLIKNT